jgi:hypothetical protein
MFAFTKVYGGESSVWELQGCSQQSCGLVKEGSTGGGNCQYSD